MLSVLISGDAMKKYFIILSILFLFSCSEDKKPNENKSQQMNNKKNDSIVISKVTFKLKPTVIEKPVTPKQKELYQKAHDLWFYGKPAEAIESLQNFINIHPNSSLADDAQNLIGTAYSNMDNFHKAIIEYQKVRDEYPNSNKSSISLYQIAHNYFYELNDFPKAKYFYEQFLHEATEEDKEWYDIAKSSLDNWSTKVKMYEGYVDRKEQWEIEQQISNSSEYLIISNHSWNKGGFGLVGLHNISIQNTSNVDFKDVVIMVNYYSESQTFLTSITKVLYKKFPAGQVTVIKDINLGFIPEYANSALITVINAYPY